MTTHKLCHRQEFQRQKTRESRFTDADNEGCAAGKTLQYIEPITLATCRQAAVSKAFRKKCRLTRSSNTSHLEGLTYP
jgi:hypothetical protein